MESPFFVSNIFKKAEAAINVSRTDGVSAKSKKSILMPPANTYFQAGNYDEAEFICDRVLSIDRKEKRAIQLKKMSSTSGCLTRWERQYHFIKWPTVFREATRPP